MPRVLRSDSLRTRTLPWEMLAHIYSFCDTPTLAVLSVVSFGSWELASPILYEHVELTSLDGIKALLFLEDAPPTARLNPAVPLLDRIKTLTIHLTPQSLETEASTPRGWYLARGDYDFAWALARLPHRLRRAGHPSALPLDQLVIFTPPGSSNVFSVVCAHLWLPVDPRRVLYQTDHEDTIYDGAWGLQSRTPDASFFAEWRALEQVIWNGTLVVLALPGRGQPVSALYQRWSRNSKESGPGATPRALELTFDFASQLHSYTTTVEVETGRRITLGLETLLGLGSADRSMADRVQLQVTLIVKQADEKAARKGVDKLEDWLKKLVVVETV